MSNIQLTQLDNGLRVITDRLDSVSSVSLGAWIGVGTRYEDKIHNGIAHMVEHMMFKGTENRTALDVTQSIENVGGSMNAYTSREITSYYMHVLQDDVSLALDVLADMVQNSNMPEEEIERERHVILQEIGMCHDTPDDLIFDNYYETAYTDQALGMPILGKANIVEAMSRDVMMGYVEKFYTPSRIVISAAGQVNHDAFVKEVEKVFSQLPQDSLHNNAPCTYTGGHSYQNKDLEQGHIILGFEGIPRTDENFYAAQALSNLFGGSMSSRLFQEIREKRGLVYSIYSFHNAYSDGGQFGIYAGTGPNDLEELVPVVCDEIKSLTSTLTEEEVRRAIVQMKAGLLMGRESTMTRADQQAKYILFRNKKLDIDALVEQIEVLTVDRIVNTAERIFSSKLTVAGLGPLDKLESYDEICKRLS